MGVVVLSFSILGKKTQHYNWLFFHKISSGLLKKIGLEAGFISWRIFKVLFFTFFLTHSCIEKQFTNFELQLLAKHAGKEDNSYIDT